MLVDPAEYEELQRAKAYLQLLAISREVKNGPGADEIYRASRQELEEYL